MAVSQNLESQLQSARLEALLPVLSELGVECCEDLEFIEEEDVEERSDITVIHKRRFFEWREKILEIPNLEVASTACSSESSRKMSAQLGSPMSRLDMPQAEFDRPSSLPVWPVQTPRTRARPLVHVLHELQLLDEALEEERDRRERIAEELQEQRNMCSKLVAELEEERQHSKGLAKELAHACNANGSDDLQAERKHSARIVEEKKANEDNHSRDIAVLEEMLEHLIKDNMALKAKVAACEPQHTTHTEAECSREPTMQPRGTVGEPELELTSASDDFTTHGHDMAGGRMSAACEPEIRHSARNSAVYEPDMEPRATLADRLSQLVLDPRMSSS